MFVCLFVCLYAEFQLIILKGLCHELKFIVAINFLH